MMNYEFVQGALTSSDDLFDHIVDEKADLGQVREVSKYVIGCGVRDIWKGSVKSRKRVLKEEKNVKRKRMYVNLKRKDNRNNDQQTNEDWNEIIAKAEVEIAKQENWQLKFISHSMFICTFVENVTYDGIRVITEIRVSQETQMEKVKIAISHHGHEMPIDDSTEMSALVNSLHGTVEKVVFLMSFFNASNICRGFLVDNENLLTEYRGELKAFNVKYCNAQEEKRAFSRQCQMFTSSSGRICSLCDNAKAAFKAYIKRKREKAAPDPRCNHRFMSREMLVEKIETEKKEKIRERQVRQNIEEQLLRMEEEDHKDLQAMMGSVKKEDIPEKMLGMWEQQQKIMQSPSKTGYRWYPEIMKLCIELYAKNPHVLDPLREFLYLPSNRSIRYHKNKIKERPGWNVEVMEWCLNEAKASNLKEHDYWGGFILDEMKIQEDLEMIISKKGTHKLIGFVDLGKAHDDMELLSGNNNHTPKLATHVLQFIFIGDSGFRFPLAQFPSQGCTASDLSMIFWEGVRMMKDIGFTIYWCVLDGAEVNRQFVKLHFTSEEEAVENNFVCQNLYTGDPVVFMFDSKHNFKKIRNNILKSSTGNQGTRCLTIKKGIIVWQQFLAAFNFDQDTFSMPLHEKLTIQHFELDPASKMRNSLAEDVLDKKMLSLIKAHKDHMISMGKDGSTLDGLIELLSHTSRTVELFHDKQVIVNVDDVRIRHLSQFLTFLEEWKCETVDNPKKFFSYKLWFDLRSMVLGFRAMVNIKLKEFPQSIIKPAIINQDAVENHFCQVRACNGQNNNPSFKLQQSVQNSIRFGQTTISRKSNSGKSGMRIKHS